MTKQIQSKLGFQGINLLDAGLLSSIVGILLHRWYYCLSTHAVRKVELREVEKALSCQIRREVVLFLTVQEI